MAVVDDSKPRRQRSEDPKGDGLKLLAQLTTGRKHEYPARAVYRGGKCTCDEQDAGKRIPADGVIGGV